MNLILTTQFLKTELSDLAYLIANEPKNYKRQRLLVIYNKFAIIQSFFVSISRDIEMYDLSHKEYFDSFLENTYEIGLICGKFSEHNFNRIFWKFLLKEFKQNYPALNLKTKKQMINYFRNFNNWKY